MNPIAIILSTAGATIMLMAAMIGFFSKDYIKRFQTNFDKLFSSFDKLTIQVSALRGDLKVLKSSYTHLDITYKDKFQQINESVREIEKRQKEMKQKLYMTEKMIKNKWESSNS